MADWAPKANYNNPLFTVYHTLQFAKHKGMYWGKKSVYRLLRPRMREHFRYASRAPPSRVAPGMLQMGLFPVFCLPVSYCEVLPARFVTPACYKTYRKIHSEHCLSLCSSKIVIHLSSSLDVCIGVCECTRALCCVVFYYPRFR